MLVFNNHKRLSYPMQQSRTMLDVIVSSDDGQSWGLLHRLESTQAEGLMFHYPSLFDLGSCKIAIAYTTSSIAVVSGTKKQSSTPAKQGFGIRVAIVHGDQF